MSKLQSPDGNKKRLEHWMIVAIILMVCDFVTIHLSYFLALWFRFDCRYSVIPAQYLDAYTHFITVYAVATIVLFWIFRMYKSMWRYASYDELMRVTLGSLIASLLHVLIIGTFYTRMPLSYYIWGSLAQLILLIVPRFSFRLLLVVRSEMKQRKQR